MHSRMRRLALLSLAGMLALGLVTVVWALGIGSSQAQQGAMQNCPQAGKWAITVWDGVDATDADQALATCGDGGIAAAYSIDAGTQAWLRWFDGRPEVSNLQTLDNMQGVVALGGPGASASAPPALSGQQNAMQNCPLPGKWAIAVWSGDDDTDPEQALATCNGESVAAAYWIDPDTQAWSRWFAGRPGISNLPPLNDRQGVLALGATGAEPTATASPTPPPTPTVTASLTVHFIDVGQGDATLIESRDTTILVDGGEASANVEDYLQTQGVQDIDLLVATHPHADHIGGLIDVLGLFDVHEIWTNGDTSGSQTYGDFAAYVTDEGATKRDVSRGYSAQMGALEIDVLHPRPPLTGNLNQDSLVLHVSCGQLDVLLTGDATTGSEARMLAAGVLGDVEVLKVGHHGSDTSTSADFLSAITPEDAVISVGAGNSYGHPHQQALDRLAAHGVTVYRTDQDGWVKLSSDCSTYHMATSSPPPSPTPTVTPTPTPTPIPTPSSTPTRTCCKYCTTGKACGNSCISRSYTCHKPPGCACNAY